MGSIKSRRLALGKLKEIIKDKSKVLLVHYSQSKTFDDDDCYGSISPIITSIVIKSLDETIDTQYAIYLEADKADIPIENIQDSYRDLELRILKSFNDFVAKHDDCCWIHWDMKNIHFGFEAIKHRYEKIFGNLNRYHEISNNRKHNLKDIVEHIYGEKVFFKKNNQESDYLKLLIECNNEGGIENTNYLNLSQESREFESKNFTSIIKSVDCKVDFLKKVTDRLIKKQLEVPNRNNLAFINDVMMHPIFSFSSWLLTIIAFVTGCVRGN